MDVMVISFGRNGSQVFNLNQLMTREIKKLLTSSWEYCHIWANPPDTEGKIVHTVNNAHRQDSPPKATLQFENGLWAIEKN